MIENNSIVTMMNEMKNKSCKKSWCWKKNLFVRQKNSNFQNEVEKIKNIDMIETNIIEIE